MSSLFDAKELSLTEAVDIIEKIVYAYMKPLGFRKHGRTLHRYVDGDISQLVNLQNGCPAKDVYNILSVNLGIRVPECFEHKFVISEPLKKYYHVYQCNIRTCLGSFVDGKDTFYDLKKDPEKIGHDIVERLEKYVLPVFDTLNSRDAILKHRREYRKFDEWNHHLILLEEAMIMGRRGRLDEASRLFNAYYQQALAKYHYDLEYGKKIYLRKGESIVCGNQTIEATEDGYVTVYMANRGHLTYLEELAQELGIILCAP